MHDGITRKQARVLIVLCTGLATLNFVCSVLSLLAYRESKAYVRAVNEAKQAADKFLTEAHKLTEDGHGLP